MQWNCAIPGSSVSEYRIPKRYELHSDMPQERLSGSGFIQALGHRPTIQEAVETLFLNLGL